MAWTWSAPQRGTVAGAAAMLSVQSRLFTQLTLLGKGDALRGLAVAVAAVLTLAGAIAPNIEATYLTALLFLAGSALAAGAAISLQDERISENTPHRPQQSVREAPSAAVSTSAAPAAFSEVIARRDGANDLDRAAWARITTHMSHELRTPLNAVLGFSELMSQEVFGPMGASCYTAYARDIHSSGRLLLKTADDALAITAMLTAPERKGPPATAGIGAPLDSALSFLAPEFGAGDITIVNACDHRCEILAEPQTLRQILINVLADTAYRAGASSTITLSSDCSAVEATIAVTLSGPRSAAASAGADSFQLLMAQTLCQLSGAHLACRTSANGDWTTTATFAPAVQRDFFSAHG